MILYEEGRWQMDDPVAKFIPGFDEVKVMTPAGDLVDPVHAPTMRELLSNTAGIASISMMNTGGTAPPPNPAAVTLARNPAVAKLYDEADLRAGDLRAMGEKLVKLPLAYQPGTDFMYGISQDVHGYVVEQISGEKFDDFLQRRIFDPLGMVDTGFGVAPDERDRLTTVYGYDADGTLTPASMLASRANGEKPVFLSGSGGLYSTAEDYLRLSAMLAQGGVLDGVRILSPATIRLMTRDLLPDGVPQNFAARLSGLGYGINVGVVLDPGRASFNSGGFGVGTYYWTGLFGSWWWNDPVNDLIVIGMSQQDGAARAHVGLPSAAPDLCPLSTALIYAALVEPGR